MMTEGCDCNWGIPGVEKLPWHDHNAEMMAADLLRLNPTSERAAEVARNLNTEPRIYVDWKTVARG